MREPGEIRRRDDGTFEYLRSTSFTLRGGLTETWESVVEHAAKQMLLPIPFLENLRAHGYAGGPHLFDLMIAEGWQAPRRDYIETGRAELEAEQAFVARALPPALDSRKLAEEQTGEYIRQTLHEPEKP